MYYLLIIFAICFLACREENNKAYECDFMTLSDAQPVQFWPIECETYNQHQNDGVRNLCFINRFGCDDEIVIQFTDIPENSPSNPHNFELSIRDGDTELLAIPFELGPRLELADLIDGENYGAGDDWSISSTPTVSSSDVSKIFRIELTNSKDNTDYEFHYKIAKTGGLFSTGTMTIGIYDASMNLIDDFDITYPNSDNVYEDNITFNSPGSIPKYIGVSNNPVGPTDIEIDEFYLLNEDQTPFTYNVSFVPSESTPELCEERVRFFIVDTTIDAEVAHSDLHQISQNVKNTILINYYNNLNIYGLIYNSNQPQFNLRIPAIFFHQKFPGEDEVMELSSSLLTLNGSVRRQRLLDTDYMPYYMHEKITLALKHQFVTIYNKQWVKQEAYEMQDGNRTYPHKKAKCYLSEKEFLQRNVL